MKPVYARIVGVPLALLVALSAVCGVSAFAADLTQQNGTGRPPAPPAAPAEAAPVEVAPADDLAEPPLQFELAIDGKKSELLLDREATVELADGKAVKLRLTAKPERQFRGGGVSFRYPRGHGFEAERDPAASFTTWTFDGNDSVLILTHYTNAIDEDDLRQSVVEGITSQYGDIKFRTENTTVSLGGVKRPATRVVVTLVGTGLVQDVCAWKAEGENGGSYSLIIQDTTPEGAPAGKPSQETARVLKLLDETFKHERK